MAVISACVIVLVAVPGLPAIQVVFGRFSLFYPPDSTKLVFAREAAGNVFFQCALYLVIKC